MTNPRAAGPGPIGREDIMKFRWTALMVLALAGALVFGCGNGDEEKITAAQVKQKAEEAAEAAAQFGKQKQQEWSNTLAESWEKMQQEGDELYQEAMKKAAQGQAKYEELAKDLVEKRRQVATKLEALHKAGKDGLEKAKEELAEALVQLKKAYAEAKAELSK